MIDNTKIIELTTMAKHIVIHCFLSSKIVESIGDVVQESDVDGDSYGTIHKFVCRVLVAFTIDYIPFSTLQAFTYVDRCLVRIVNCDFLHNNSQLYVCTKEDKSNLLKFLNRRDMKEEKKASTQSVNLSETTSKGDKKDRSTRVNMGRNTLERLQYHKDHKDDLDYTK